MAQFYKAFADYPNGSQPADWTEIWDTAAATWNIGNGAYGAAKSLLQNLTSSVYNALTWNTVPLVADAEIVVKCYLVNGLDPGLFLRASGTSSVSTYGVFLGTSSLQIYRQIGGAGMPLGSASVSGVSFHWVWLRARISGTTISARVWLDGAAEPGAWNLTVTDGNIVAAGQVAIGQKISTGSVSEYALVGIGTNGDTAPISSSGTGVNMDAIVAITADISPNLVPGINLKATALSTVNLNAAISITIGCASIVNTLSNIFSDVTESIAVQAQLSTTSDLANTIKQQINVESTIAVNADCASEMLIVSNLTAVIDTESTETAMVSLLIAFTANVTTESTLISGVVWVDLDIDIQCNNEFAGQISLTVDALAQLSPTTVVLAESVQFIRVQAILDVNTEFGATSDCKIQLVSELRIPASVGADLPLSIFVQHQANGKAESLCELVISRLAGTIFATSGFECDSCSAFSGRWLHEHIKTAVDQPWAERYCLVENPPWSQRHQIGLETTHVEPPKRGL